MEKRSIVLLIILGIGLVVGWQYLMQQIWPVKPPVQKPEQETVALVMGGAVMAVEPVNKYKHDKLAELPKPKEEPKQEVKKVLPEIKPAELPKDRPELIAMGHGGKPYYLQLLLNTRGGCVQQVLVTEFKAADREGLAVKINGETIPLHLVPGVRLNRADTIRGQRNIVNFELKPGVVQDLKTFDEIILGGSSFVLYHYDKATDERPLDELGNRNWKVVERSLDPDADEQKVVFQTELAEPHNLQITKTFTLKRKDYHVGLKVDFKRLPGKTGPNQFRYQLKGAHGLPIEGEWYTSIYRQVIVGFSDSSRFLADARTIRETEGSERETRTGKQHIRYAACTNQYFASLVAVDDDQANRNFLEFVRATSVGPTNKGKEFLDDVTVRAITEAFDPDQETSHKYLLYQGPVKVRLLRLMPEQQAVDGALVDRYLDQLNLNTMTDAPMSNALGSFASAIYWTDLVIAFTNLIHSLLWALNQIIPSLGVCILVITVMVRGMLFPLSRRQTQKMQVMQQKMAKLQPELKKIEEKYQGDPQKIHQEKFRCMREHNVNPFGAMSGCLLLLLQMPVFMGLYYALQESVFLRLAPFLWIPNLAAPDMLVFWGESIPFISTPNDLGSPMYLGPFLNILPVLAVLLMLYQQKKMMPLSDDPQVQAQQRMMKFMMVIMGVFFYKMPAGLCLYFIVSTLWGLTERKLLPKTKAPEDIANSLSDNGQKDFKPPRPLGWWGRRKALWREKWKELLEQAQKQAEHRQAQQPQSPQNPDRNGGGDGGGKKKKKKKR